MMSKKHYVQFAEMLKKYETRIKYTNNYVNGNADDELNYLLNDIKHDIADIFQSDNPNFDRNRFLTACGLSSKK